MTPEDAYRFVRSVNALESVERAGFAMRGVDRPESVAAHTLGVLAAAFVVSDLCTEPVDRAKLALMVLLHDLGETIVGDIPLTRKRADDRAREDQAMAEILAPLPVRYRETWAEYRAEATLEARIVKGCDKLQMMARVREYEEAGRGSLAEFWENPANFRDGGVDEIRRIYRVIDEDAGPEASPDRE